VVTPTTAHSTTISPAPGPAGGRRHSLPLIPEPVPAARDPARSLDRPATHGLGTVCTASGQPGRPPSEPVSRTHQRRPRQQVTKEQA
jgi:hypothetical protein